MKVRIRKFSKCVKAPKVGPQQEVKLTVKLEKEHTVASLNKLAMGKDGPRTRLQKLRQESFVCPKSTDRKIVFVTNTDGNGFQDERDIEFPPEIPVQEMKDQINRACYDRWRQYREYNEKDIFQKKDHLTNKIVGIGVIILLLFLIPVLLGAEIQELLDLLIFTSSILMLAGIVNACYTFSQEFPTINYDKETIESVVSLLGKFNRIEREQNMNKPRFQWSYGDDCLWIAVEFLNRSIRIEEVSSLEERSLVPN